MRDRLEQLLDDIAAIDISGDSRKLDVQSCLFTIHEELNYLRDAIETLKK